MKRIIHEVPRWHLYLHRDALGLGVAEVSDSPTLQLGDELFERLYSGEAEALPDEAQGPLTEWAKKLHETCSELPAFQRLASEVRGDAFAAAMATEKVLDELEPRVPGAQEAPSPTPNPAAEGATLRRLIGKGCAQASAAVEEIRETCEGLSGVGYGSSPGAKGCSPGIASRALVSRLRQDERLRRIASLAGRFKRIAAGRLRQKVKHGMDEVSDIEPGSDLARLLPTELGRLIHPRLKLAFLRDLTEGNTLQYQLRGTDRLGNGPLIVCLDKSGSMAGSKDIWATAVALALLEVAQRERRPFAIIAFDAEVKYEAIVQPGELLPEQALFVGCDGGTGITKAIDRGLQIIRTHPGKLRKSDIVLVTDGLSDTAAAESMREAATKIGVAVLGLGIEVPSEDLMPWCDEAQTISDLNSLPAGPTETLLEG